MSSPELLRLTKNVRNFTTRHQIPPTITEMARASNMGCTQVFELIEAEGSGLRTGWTGPRPKGIGAYLVEIDDGT